MSLPAGASAQPTRLSPLARGLSYYHGKTVTLVAPDSPGGGFDQWARLLQPALSAYLHATVNVENIPAGNTVAGQDSVAKAAPNGLTVGWLNAGPDIEDTILGLPALNFNPVREAFLGATAPGQTAILTLNTAACSKWRSFANLVQHSSASNPVSEVLQTSGTGTFFMLMTNAAFGIHFRPLTGYQSTSSQVQGFIRGDGCVSEVPASVAAPLVKGGKATAVALSVPLQKGSAIAGDFRGVPTIAQEAAKLSGHISTRAQKNALLALNDVAASTRVFFTASAVPTPQVTALQAAFHWAMGNGSLRANAIAEGNPVGYESGTFAKQQYQTFLKDSGREVPILKPVLG
ncbi:MAG TPA: hypothetical protein VNF07_02630 [Acidimicrobiales bacterium]|nr:hypothetical protein [Acidimicrobiales bacterium]